MCEILPKLQSISLAGPSI